MEGRDTTVEMIDSSYRQWFPDLDEGAAISEAWRSERIQSTLVRYEIADGRTVRSVIMKRNRLTDDVADRPRLGLRSGFENKHRHEAAALRAIHEALSSTDEFDAVRVLAELDEGLILEAAEGRNLGSIIRRTHGFTAAELMRRSGELLRMAHSAQLDLPVVRGTGVELARSFEAFLQFLHPELSAVDALVPQLERIAAIASELGPLTVGIGHGDFAPRNLLVGPEGLLTMLDPLGSQLVPVQEDLAYFALALRRGVLVPWLGPLSERVAARLEAALLVGYGNTPGFRYDAISALVALDALAADKVRLGRRTGVAKGLATRTLPDTLALVGASAARAIEASARSGVGA